MPDATRKLVIAIDGPAGAGKSTIAARLAQKLGYTNLESGAMYRALALKAIEGNVSQDDEAQLLALAKSSDIRLQPTGEGNRVFLDGSDVSGRIRERDVTDAASRVSVHPRVRAWMVARQREMGLRGGVIMEGRDIGTKVFPDADLKIFLDAAPEVRQERRIQQRGAAANQEEAQRLASELAQRDLRDRTRAASPLEAAPDAVHIDSSVMGVDEVVRQVEELARARMKNQRP
jgi:CMP/dCMP kinase